MEEILKLNSVIKMFPPHQRIINDVSLTVLQGETVSITGEKSSGKTTLLHLICGIIPPEDGTVLLCGKDITNMGSNAVTKLRSSLIGVMSPDLDLQENMTVMDNVCLPLAIQGMDKKARQKKAMEYLCTADMKEVIHVKPKALNIYQKKCIKLIGACIHQPKLIIIDDFLCGICEKENVDLQNHLKALRPSNCALITLSTTNCTVANRLYNLKNGKLEEVR